MCDCVCVIVCVCVCMWACCLLVAVFGTPLPTDAKRAFRTEIRNTQVFLDKVERFQCVCRSPQKPPGRVACFFAHEQVEGALSGLARTCLHADPQELEGRKESDNRDAHAKSALSMHCGPLSTLMSMFAPRIYFSADSF